MSKRIYISGILIFIFALLFVPMASHAYWVKQDNNVFIQSSEVIDDDLFAIGSTINIDGVVKGDLVALGQTITINGVVEGDVIAAGSNIVLNAQVKGDARMAAGNIQINGKVGKNLNAFAGNVLIGKDTIISGNALIGAGMEEISGDILGNLWVYGSQSKLNGTVEKDATIKLDQKGSLTLSPTAIIKGNVNYRSAKPLIQESGAVVQGKITQEMPKVTEKQKTQSAWPGYVFGKIISMLAMMVVGLVLVALFKEKLFKLTDVILKNPWPSLGWGVVFLAAIPILSIIFLITIIGIPLAIISLIAYGIILYLSSIFTAILVGQGIVNAYKKKAPLTKGNLYAYMVVGVLVIGIICMFPVLGFFTKVLAMLAGTGALVKIALKV